MSAIRILVDYRGEGDWTIEMPPREFPGRPITRHEIGEALRRIADGLQTHSPGATLPVGYPTQDHDA